jgi:hypothetical protein
MRKIERLALKGKEKGSAWWLYPDDLINRVYKQMPDNLFDQVGDTSNASGWRDVSETVDLFLVTYVVLLKAKTKFVISRRENIHADTKRSRPRFCVNDSREEARDCQQGR